MCELLHTSHKNATSRYQRLCLQATPPMIIRPVNARPALAQSGRVPLAENFLRTSAPPRPGGWPILKKSTAPRFPSSVQPRVWVALGGSGAFDGLEPCEFGLCLAHFLAQLIVFEPQVLSERLQVAGGVQHGDGKAAHVLRMVDEAAVATRHQASANSE